VIVTVTLNPSLDRTIEVGGVVRGALVRGTSTRVDAGGKGVNVARALTANGVPARAVLPLGGPDGERLLDLLTSAGLDVVAVPVRSATRSNVSLVEPDGTTTKVNEPGGRLDRDDVEALVASVLAAATGADWAVLCGSLPPGVPHDVYARLCRALQAAGTSVAVDSSGLALTAALDVGPALVKPNREELAETAGRPLLTLGDVLTAAEELRARGAGSVLASLGADGALLVERAGVLRGRSTVLAPRSSVGAGDAMLAGFLSAGAAGAPALATALAWGAAAAGLPGSRMPTTSDLRPDDVTTSPLLDRTTPLSTSH